MLNFEEQTYLAEKIFEISDELRYPGEPWAAYLDDYTVTNEKDALLSIANAISDSDNYNWIFSFLFNLMAEDDYIGDMASEVYGWLAEHQQEII